MMLWEHAPYTEGGREIREGLGDTVVQAALDAASGSASSRMVAVVEACAGLWERGFASADSERLSPAQLAMAGRALLLRGECVYARERGRIGAMAASYDVSGRGDPSAWRYRLSLPTPSTTRTVTRSAGDVLHVRIGATAAQPWRGVSPLANSAATRTILERLEQSLSYEAGGPVGTGVPVPDPANSGSLKDDLASLRGRAALVPSTSTNWAQGGPPPRRDWSTIRFGPNPPAGEVTARRDVETSVAAAAGVPALLLSLGGEGDAREAWRQFVYSTIRPVARLMEAELDRIGLPGTISFERLAASDLSARSRAYQSLTGGGMDAKRAAEIAGFARS